MMSQQRDLLTHETIQIEIFAGPFDDKPGVPQEVRA